MNKMNLINVYQWLNNKLFDTCRLPEGINREILSNYILDEYGEFTPLCDNPDFFKSRIDNWFNAEYDNFDRINKALNLEYNVIDNYDRTEEFIDTNTGNRNNTNKNTNQVSAYNSETFTNASQDNGESGETSRYETMHTAHIHGNIGVTTSAQMLEGEVNLRMRYDIYNIIAVAFFKKFMLHCL